MMERETRKGVVDGGDYVCGMEVEQARKDDDLLPVISRTSANPALNPGPLQDIKGVSGDID